MKFGPNSRLQPLRKLVVNSEPVATLRYFRDKISTALQERLPQGSEPVVTYTAYPFEMVPVDNLSKVAIKGKVRFVQPYNERFDHSGSGGDYISELLESPTMLEVALLAEDMIRTTGDRHHHCLEALRVAVEQPEEGVKHLNFCMGC